MSLRTLCILAVAVFIAIALRHHRARLEGRVDRTASPAEAEVTDAAGLLRSMSAGTTRPAPTSKPWIDDFAGFVSSHPGRWIVGRSAVPCLSEPEAARAAQADAARQITPLIVSGLPVHASDAATIEVRMESDLQSAGSQTDRLAEQFTRPYGTVWTESVLIDASQQRLDELSGRYATELAAKDARMSNWRLTAAVVVGAAWLFYFLLNAVTKGYFTVRLGAVAATITAAAIVLVV